MSFLLSICIVLAGCSSNELLQPSRAEIAGANLFLTSEPTFLTLDLKLTVPSGTVMYYNSNVTAYGEDAVWDGVAKVYYRGMYFRQECKTVCSNAGSRKLWRESWAESDVGSPAEVLTEWLGKVDQGSAYLTRPVIPAEQSEHLASFTAPAYRFTWAEGEPAWKSLCDAHPDKLFGGDALLSDFSQVKITMFFGTDDLVLDVIMLTAEADGRWLSYTIVPGKTKEAPDTSFDGTIKHGVLLREEWELIYSYVTEEE